MPGGTWLCDDDMARERMLDIERHMAPKRKLVIGVIGVSLLASAPWVGWWWLIALVIPLGAFALADRSVHSQPRPETSLFIAWAAGEVTVAVAVSLSQGPHSPGLPWLAIPVVVLSARFSKRGVITGVLLTLLLLLGAGFSHGLRPVLDEPPILIGPAALIVSVALLTTALRRADLEHRRNSLIDTLTGMLTRRALVSRVDELAELSRLTREPVGVVLADVDRFKEINDSLGHGAGDAALAEVAQRIRGRVRAFDLAYRVGGDEFVILLPGADEAQAAQLAEELRAVAEEDRVAGGATVTMSLGVAASPRGEVFDFDAVFAAADLALYEAKDAGRNCVRSGGKRAAELGLTGSAA
jgi:diguanylate cyclase (GGDEF)-like protein